MKPTSIGGGPVVLLVAALLAGCSETVSVRSGPPGANVSLDGRPIGTTPVDYSLSRSALGDPHQVCIEKPGYAPVQTELRTRLARGRVTGAVFTLGIVALVRPLHSVDPVFAQLVPLHPAQEDQDRRVGETLRNLRELHQNGKISDEELRRRQDELLRGGSR